MRRKEQEGKERKEKGRKEKKGKERKEKKKITYIQCDHLTGCAGWR